MAVLSQRKGAVAILFLGPPQGQGDFAACHREVLRLAQEEQLSKFIIDLASVTRVTSAQLSLLITIHRAVRDQRGELKLANVSEPLHRILTRTRLARLFKSYDSVEQAIASFETAQAGAEG
ncbi:MAG: STAS domain-containing protein [Candidatus Latescibacteria bacterium]|nr:STAS domain-containing protein [Candidatus Latescibacterota bacterium]